MSVAEWADLTADEQTSLLLAATVNVDAQLYLLNADLTVTEDLTEDLVLAGSSVTWAGYNTVHRGCTLVLTRELSWGTALVQVYQVLTDVSSGLSARRPLGVFTLNTPTDNLGQTVTDLATGATSRRWTVTGQDRLYLLDRQAGVSYTVPAASNVLGAVGDVLTAAGLGGLLADSSKAASTTPTDMVWPLVAPAVGAPALAQPQDVTAAGAGDTTTWLDIVNDLLALISYRGVWADENGLFRATPYADPSSRPVTHTWDSDDPLRSTVTADRSRTQDLWAAPNRWIFVWQNMPTSGGSEQTPTVGNGGVYIVDNVDDGPSSQSARGLVWPTQVGVTAASAADVIAQGDARVAADKRVQTTYAATTSAYPPAGHFDVFTFTDTAAGGAVKVQATSWRINLDSALVAWQWEGVG